MIVEFAARFFNGLVRATACGSGTHDLSDANFGSTPVIGGHAATHIVLGDNTDQLEVFFILYYGRAAAT